MKLDHSPLCFSAKLKMAIAAVKMIWVHSDDKTGESEDINLTDNFCNLFICQFKWFANVFVALNFVTLLDFSDQDFILETVRNT